MLPQTQRATKTDPGRGVQREAPLTVTVLVVPGFSLNMLALCVDAMRVANREALRTVFDWRIASETGAPAASSAGIAVPADVPISAISASPVSVVLASYEPERGCGEGLLRWLRRQHRGGATLCCADTGALVLARAGVARGHTLSVHPLALDGAREDFPEVRFSDRRISAAARLLSCTGGVATLDMMLVLVERTCGRVLAAQVARLMNHAPRAEHERALVAHVPAHPVLARCIDLMHAHIEEPMSLQRLSTACGVPLWTLRRLFVRHLSTTPTTHYRGIRLTRGRQLLAYSHLSVTQVAAACGFADLASFSRAFRRHFGRPPSASRADDPGLPSS